MPSGFVVWEQKLVASLRHEAREGRIISKM